MNKLIDDIEKIQTYGKYHNILIYNNTNNINFDDVINYKNQEYFVKQVKPYKISFNYKNEIKPYYDINYTQEFAIHKFNKQVQDFYINTIKQKEILTNINELEYSINNYFYETNKYYTHVIANLITILNIEDILTNYKLKTIIDNNIPNNKIYLINSNNWKICNWSNIEINNSTIYKITNIDNTHLKDNTNLILKYGETENQDRTLCLFCDEPLTIYKNEKICKYCDEFNIKKRIS